MNTLNCNLLHIRNIDGLIRVNVLIDLIHRAVFLFKNKIFKFELKFQIEWIKFNLIKIEQLKLTEIKFQLVKNFMVINSQSKLK